MTHPKRPEGAFEALMERLTMAGLRPQLLVLRGDAAGAPGPEEGVE